MFDESKKSGLLFDSTYSSPFARPDVNGLYQGGYKIDGESF